MGLLNNLFRKRSSTFKCAKCGLMHPKSEGIKVGGNILCKPCVTAHNDAKGEKRFVLFGEGDQFEGRTIELVINNNSEASIVDTGWWVVHRGASNAGQTELKLKTNYFANNSLESFIELLTNTYKKDFSHLKNKQDIIDMFPSSKQNL